MNGDDPIGLIQHFAIDLDGTLAEYQYGYARQGKIGEPLIWGLPFINNALKNGHKVTIFTARPWDQHKLIKTWLKENHFPDLDITCVKRPEFTCYIDDKAVQFRSSDQMDILRMALLKFRPWWDRKD